MSAKQYLIETEDDADAMNADESNYGYREQNKDENAYKKAKFKKRAKPNSRLNKSPPGALTTQESTTKDPKGQTLVWNFPPF